jgi:hypothetical protein
MRLSNTLMLAIPVGLAFALGDVSRVGATPPIPSSATSAWACVAEDPAKQVHLQYIHYIGVANTSTSSVSVVCPVGMTSGGNAIVYASGYKGVTSKVVCDFQAFDRYGWTKATGRGVSAATTGNFDATWTIATPDVPTFTFARCTLPGRSATGARVELAHLFLAQDF